MKEHTPVRTPTRTLKTQVPIRPAAKSIEMVPRLSMLQRFTRSWERICLIFLVSAMIVAGFATYQKQRRDQFLLEIYKNWDDESRKKINQLVTEREAARQELEAYRAQQNQTDETLKDLESRAEQFGLDRDMLAQDATELRAELESLRGTHFERLVTSGQLLKTDPWLSRRTLDDAVQFANATMIDPTSAERLLTTLPAAQSLPAGSTVTVLDVRREAGWLVADIVVTDSTGHFLTGLTRADFEILTEDRRLHFVAVGEARRGDRTHDIVLLLDTSGSAKGEPHQAMQQGSSQLVTAMANPSSFRVYGFADGVTPFSPWSIDGTLHQGAIEALTSGGGTALYKAIRVAMDDLLTRSGSSRSIVLFTDGSDSFNDEDIEKTLAACREHAISIHVLMLATAEVNEPMLRRIAGETNGMFLSASDPARLSQEFAAVTAAFQRPVYRLAIFEPVDEGSLTLKVGTLPEVSLNVAAGESIESTGT